MFEQSEAVQDPLHHNVIPIQSVLAHGDLEAWQTLSAPFCSIQPLNSARMQGENDISVTRVGAIGLFGGVYGGHLLRRSHVNLSDTPGFVLITRYDAGCLTGMMNDTAFSVQAGDLVLRDLDSRFEALRCPSRFEAVLVPRQLLGLEMGQVPDLRILQRDDPAVEDMRNIMQEAFKASRGGTSVFSFGLMQRLLTMVRAILLMPQRGLSPRRAARQSQLRQILHFIELNLGRLDLSAETLLPEFGLSRATLYRLFEPQGGVRNYIVNRRLFRALLEIADAPSRRGKIQLAAKRWGFSSPSNFNRSVQHVFGASPGALLTKPLKRELPTPPMTQIAHADVLSTP